MADNNNSLSMLTQNDNDAYGIVTPLNEDSKSQVEFDVEEDDSPASTAVVRNIAKLFNCHHRARTIKND